MLPVLQKDAEASKFYDQPQPAAPFYVQWRPHGLL
jgi:hypothetical protein